ncbi:MAG: 8-amino-7-oxononanoate synthase [Taibaiella sp.]|nr:8-amino-7-oxononanoate synthase [Taibaiella sp.]
MSRLNESLLYKLNQRQAAGNLRRLSVAGTGIDFYSNDYLGLSTTGILEKLTNEANAGTASGATGSRLISGNSAAMETLERHIAAFHGTEAALLYNSGYDANTGLISAIADRHTIILYDELCHASIIDGIRLSLCKGKFTFRHNDLHDLQHLLQRHTAPATTVLVITESVFSMDGDFAPLAAIAGLCNTAGAELIVDEAHATGVFGPKGAGLVSSMGLEEQVFARVHTFGKALGCHGAVVTCSAMLKEYLVNFSRSFIYTTALPPHSVRAIQCAYNYLGCATFTHQPLHDLITYFHQKTAGNPAWVPSHSPVQALITDSNTTSLTLAEKAAHAGYLVKAVLSPTVPAGKERIRVCLHAFNTKEDVEGLLGVVR